MTCLAQRSGACLIAQHRLYSPRSRDICHDKCGHRCNFHDHAELQQLAGHAAVQMPDYRFRDPKKCCGKYWQTAITALLAHVAQGALCLKVWLFCRLRDYANTPLSAINNMDVTKAQKICICRPQVLQLQAHDVAYKP